MATPKQKMIGALLLLGAAIFGVISVVAHRGGMSDDQVKAVVAESNKQKADKALARRNFVRDLGNGQVSTEGKLDEGLYIDMSVEKCTFLTLGRLLEGVSDQLMKLEFEWARCQNGIKITAPWTEEGR